MHISTQKTKSGSGASAEKFKKVQQSALLPRIHKGRLTEFGRTRSRKMENGTANVKSCEVSKESQKNPTPLLQGGGLRV